MVWPAAAVISCGVVTRVPQTLVASAQAPCECGFLLGLAQVGTHITRTPPQTASTAGRRVAATEMLLVVGCQPGPWRCVVCCPMLPAFPCAPPAPCYRHGSCCTGLVKGCPAPAAACLGGQACCQQHLHCRSVAPHGCHMQGLHRQQVSCSRRTLKAGHHVCVSNQQDAQMGRPRVAVLPVLLKAKLWGACSMQGLHNTTFHRTLAAAAGV